MKNPLVSVIIPCYNAEKYLSLALQSIVNQSYQHIEILLIDDGCTDQSASIYESFAQKDTRISIVKNEVNLGLIKTLNKGIQLANGKYIARMDADDISEVNRIEKQVNFLSKNSHISVLGTGAIPIDQDGNTSINKEVLYLSPNTIKYSALFTQPLFHGSILAKTEVLKAHPYSLDYKHSEDFELWLRLLSHGHKIANLATPLYYYRNNPDSVSNNNTTMQEESHNMASKRYIEKLLNRTVDLQVVSIVNNRPAHPVTLRSFKLAKALLNEIILLANPSDELKSYFIRQKINIAIQVAKRTKNPIILIHAFCFIVYAIGFNKIGFVYLLNKLKS